MCEEKDILYKEIELELDDVVINKLVEYATINILNDKNALINWAVNDILKQVVETDGKILDKKEK